MVNFSLGICLGNQSALERLVKLEKDLDNFVAWFINNPVVQVTNC